MMAQMKPLLIQTELPALLADAPPAFRVVTIYEDGDSGRRARQFADEVLRDAEQDCEGTTNYWSFDVLECKQVRNAAASAAAGADLVIFSASGERECSPALEEWLEMWAWLIGENDPALVALLEKADGRNARRIRVNLQAIAERKTLEFVAFHVPAAAEWRELERESLATAAREGTNPIATAG
jgi:hypothetical protein